MDHFETSRLKAERLSPKHTKELLAMHGEAKVMNTLGVLKTREQSQGWLQNNLHHWEQYGYGIWMFYDKEDGQFVGRGGLRNDDVEGTKEIEVEYALMPHYWGKGLGTEIGEAVVSHAKELGLKSIVAYTQKDHASSINIMKKMGFTYERDMTYAEHPHVLYRMNLNGLP
jgi:[ribosomal protein S5]-alanine N-acetyltransferase